LQQQPLTEDKDVQRFMLEAKAASAISHPNVITIFDFGVTAQGKPYIVMDYLDGISLDDLLKKQKVELKRILGILAQVCDAMTAAHKKGIIHRDLKPTNIMLIKTDDGTDFVKVVDFGMAKFLIESEDLKLSKSSDLFGTPLYMSPEHFQGLKLDVRSDIYGLGCVLYEALTGNPPFMGNSLFDVMNKHLNEKPSMMPFMRPGKGLSPELESLLLSMLAKDREQRPQTMAEVKACLLQIRTD
jgi:serine/threonine-protein kinase